MTLQQLHAQLRFEPRNVLADGRLRATQLASQRAKLPASQAATRIRRSSSVMRTYTDALAIAITLSVD
jgi:hypothetical protein